MGSEPHIWVPSPGVLHWRDEPPGHLGASVHKSVGMIHHIDKLRNKNHTVTSVYSEKAFDKLQHPLTITDQYPKYEKNAYNTTSEKKKTPNNPINKCAEDPQKRHSNGHQTHEKMFNITNHQRNANQNRSVVLSHTCQMAIIQKDSK